MDGSSRVLALGLSADKSSRLFADIAPWLIVLVGVVLVGGVLIYLLRRWLRGDQSGSLGGFTLQDLRDLHKAGELSDEEFDRAKAQMIGRLKSAAQPPADPEIEGPPGNSNT